MRAVKEYLKEEDLVYIGSMQGQDRAWFENDEDFDFKYFLKTRGVVNQGRVGKIISLFKIIGAVFEVRKLLKKHEAKVVFSVVV